MTTEEKCVYTAYIEDLINTKYRGDDRNTLGRCDVEARAMKKKFPELTIVKGFAHIDWGIPIDDSPEYYKYEPRREHHWLVDEEGNIYDPTAGQFPRITKYEPYKEGDHVRLGVCMNCGKPQWGPPMTACPTFCSDPCRIDYENYLYGERMKGE